MTTTHHHPSCPTRQHQHSTACPVTTVTRKPLEGPWTTVTSVELDCNPACLCGPEAQAEDGLILMGRTPDEALLDIFSHASQAQLDWTDNAHRRGAPKGLLSCVLLDNEQLGTEGITASLGVMPQLDGPR